MVYWCHYTVYLVSNRFYFMNHYLAMWYTHTHMYTHTFVCLCTHTHACKHTHIYTYTCTYAHTCAHTRTYMHTHMRAHTHSDTHTYIHTNAHTHTQTHTHTLHCERNDLIWTVSVPFEGELLLRIEGHLCSPDLYLQPSCPLLLTHGTYSEENAFRVWAKHDFTPLASFSMDDEVPGALLCVTPLPPPPPPPPPFLSSLHLPDNLGSRDSSVARVPDLWSGHRFQSQQEQQENVLLRGQLSVLTRTSVSVPPRVLLQ